MTQPRQITPIIIVLIKLVALGTAIASTSTLIYGFGFNDYVAIALGIAGYFVVKAGISIAVGYGWGRQDARELKGYLATLPGQVKLDIVDHAPQPPRSRGGKNPLFKEEQFRAVAAIAFECLDMQRVLTRKDEYFIEARIGRINGQALGYVFGFLDALLQAKGLDIRDSEGQSIVLHLLAKLFPAEAGRVGTFVMRLRGMSNDAEVMNGMMLGGKQAIEFLRDKRPPVRWPTCFSAELPRLAAERDRKIR
jgi:hypothetical protein